MIRSMTAYASAEADSPLGRLALELRTVNHRYLEVSLRLPEELRAFESALRDRIAQRLARGKVDVALRLRAGNGGGARALRLNEAYLRQLADSALHLSGRFPELSVEFTELLRLPGVVEQVEPDQQALGAALLALADRTLTELGAAREREGARLGEVMAERLQGIAAQVMAVRAAMPEIRAAQRGKLDALLVELKDAADPARIEKELVAQLLRLDVDEELDRLDAHVAEARRVLALSEPVGRRLDFLLQEFNREANTLGSKSVDPRNTQAAVELKVLIEQIREQVQNIE
ncbi:MAG TPA: YicC/YloC family endoribonuclease [Rhodanobacteraceae bacterium]|nr:YicC/YloC family endoribonuclease [Rhodanobacteraceae bacterium]